MYLIFDTETTGLPKNYNAPITDTDNWPRCVQIAWQLHDALGNVIEHQDYIIYPDNFNIPYEAETVHGISTALAKSVGVEIQEVLTKFQAALTKAQFVVGHNVGFDINIMGCEFYRYQTENLLINKPVLDTCTEQTASLLKLPGGKGGRFKLPTLSELHTFLFNIPFVEAHNATADVEATTRCFLELIRQERFAPEELKQPVSYIKSFKEHNFKPFEAIGLTHVNLKKASDKLRQKKESDSVTTTPETVIDLTNVAFAHLHNHSQFSVLQSTIPVQALVKAAVAEKMPAVALTDIGNMMGAFQFVNEVNQHNANELKKQKQAEERNEHYIPNLTKAIVGCELYVCDDHTNKKVKDNGYLIVFLAKNKNGYHNLAKMSSLGYTDGFYYVPRIDRKIVEQYKEDVIVLSGGLSGEIPSKLLNVGESQAEEALVWWKQTFGDDFYIELMRHNQEDENRINADLIRLANKHQIAYVATNNVFYLTKQDANAHDILLCVRDSEKQATPIGRGRGNRYGLPNQEYYFKSADEMKALFTDVPKAITNISALVDKVESFELARKVLLPKFEIPEEFKVAEDAIDEGKRGENAYLKHLTFEGAKKRYGEITDEIRERLDFELKTIENTGYPGYFLIVQDFIAAARKMGVAVGPGRGSAAGSAVAYCLWITNIDPIKYDLLFERFLNPDRVSLPDIDIDFDDEGRSKVMDYVIEKYGKNQVAQIITYGKMAPKSALRDTARVLDLSLFEADKIAKLIPAMMPSKWSLKRFLSDNEDEIKKAVRSDDFDKIRELIQLSKEDTLVGETIQQAKILEGSLRNTGIHACGVIITPDDITKFVPIATAKDSDLNVTQFDNAVVESAGLLKMDFLGLKTLTLIKDTVKLVKYRHGIELDPEAFPIDDKKTYELFQRGDTVGIFQYESAGMQKYMRELKPTVFADLIAMNALYRPGPLEYIPSFIRRKNGEEPISYDLDALEEYLKETYGITVYQEQVMLLSQKLANFTKGDADVLRKAMGKKQIDVLSKMKSRFIEGAVANGHPEDKLEKIWRDWEAFAQYAFNKSHSTCYAWVAYQTAYLKAHYPAEYMAAVLSNNMSDIKQVSFFMEECRRIGLQVLGPDVNESFYKFTVNDKGAIRFGIGAVRGVGAGAVDTIVKERQEKGKYRSVFDLVKRIDLRAANKRTLENLALAGGFDCFTDVHRAQYFSSDGDNLSFLEKVIRYGAKHQESENSSQVSLFGESSDVQIPEPTVPPADEWSTMNKLAREKEVVGLYLSGHPLDDFRYEMRFICNNRFSELQELRKAIGKKFTFGGIITSVQHLVSKNDKPYGSFTLEGYDESYEFRMFGDEYLKFRHYLAPSQLICVRVEIKEGYRQKDGSMGEPKILYTQFMLMHDVMEKEAKKLSLRIPIQSVKSDLILSLKKLFESYPGNKSLSVEVVEFDTTQMESAATAEPLMLEDMHFSDGDAEAEWEVFSDEDTITETISRTSTKEETKYRVMHSIPMTSRSVRVQLGVGLLSSLEALGVEFSIS